MPAPAKNTRKKSITGKHVKTKKKQQNNKITNYFSSSRVTPTTPRTNYQKKYFDGKKIMLYGSSEINKVVFQVSFQNKEQFENYVGLSYAPKTDCFFQTLFSLGLRDLQLLKKNAEDINLHAKEGVKPSKVMKYITESFGLKKSNVEGWMVNLTYDNKNTNSKISEFLNTYLVNNHATILCLDFLEQDETNQDVELNKHYIVAYKYKNEVFYFDPQRKINEKNIVTIIPETMEGNTIYIIRFSFFTIENLKAPMPLINSVCEIPYYG